MQNPTFPDNIDQIPTIFFKMVQSLSVNSKRNLRTHELICTHPAEMGQQDYNSILKKWGIDQIGY